jgi:hypothetical protein
MIIQQVDLFPLFHPLSEPYGDANGYKRYRTCLERINSLQWDGTPY